ncbi:ATP-binding protein [Rhodovulum sp. DZ06]|uniref:ATP-binding protein n=1 Tax=Rhodovulum sp. DZ06 TaxID=3425126 RepID=UPI003D326CAB
MPDVQSSPVRASSRKAMDVVILAADVVGYTRLMADDKDQTVADLETARNILTSAAVAHGGRIADVTGDAAIAVFDTSVGAVLAAQAAQSELSEIAAHRPAHRRMLMRMGIHAGEVLETPDGAVFGDAVNIAARLESLAPEGGIAVSAEVQTRAQGRAGLVFDDQGEFDVKNFDRPIHVHLVSRTGVRQGLESSRKAERRLVKGNLPVRPTDLVGRAQALREVSSLLRAERMVTLFGMGGMGKTSMSIETGRRVAPDYPDGVWFADLAAVDDPGAVAHAVAGVFQVAQAAGKGILESLEEALRGQRLLLILDNCEHVTEAAAKLADALLAACPRLRIIATSREALSIGGERIWPLPPLETAGKSAPAAELFVERARAVAPGFRAEAFAPEITEICRTLDGVPLAIELAAARCRSMTPKQILARLGERFRLLTGGSRAVRARHQTLLEAVQWSYDLLTEPERQVLDRASVFAGGFTLEAAEAVCAGGDVDEFDVCDILDSLVRKSLLTAQHGGEAVRYGMLETIRAFSGARLSRGSDETRLRKAHGAFFSDQADENFALWRSPDQHVAHAWLDAEINNLRNAFRWAQETGEVDIAARIASSVGDMARFRLVEEAANWAEDVVEAAQAARHPRTAILLTWSASSAWAFQRFDDAKRFGEAALELLDDPHYDDFVWAYGDLAFVSMYAGDVDGAVELLARGAAHPADRVDRFIMAFHLYILAATGKVEEARAIADDVVAKVDAAGVPMAIAIAHGGKGAALEPVDPPAALAAYEHAVEAARRSGAKFMETLVAPRAAALQGRIGDPAEALRGVARMIESFGEATDIASVSAWRMTLAALFARVGLNQAAATLHGSLSGVIDEGGMAPEYLSAVEGVRQALGAAVFDEAAARGAAMAVSEASGYATVQVSLALAALENAGAAAE